MKLKSINFSKSIFNLALLFITGKVLLERCLENRFPLFWLDEALELFVTIHTPFSENFYIALKKIISSMPLFYLEYWLYLKTLYHILPLNDLMRHMEFYLRLPLTFFSIITIFSIYIMINKLSRSYVFAGLTTFLLFTINYLSSHLGGELRFHSAGFAHCALSWSLFTLFLTNENTSTKSRYLYFTLWILTALLAGASHIYSTYSLFLQIFIYLFVCLNLFPGISISNINLPAKVLGFFILLAGAVAEGIFFIFSSIKPYPRDALLTDAQAFQKSLNLLSSYIFIPSVWIWLSLFCLFGLITFIKKSDWTHRLKISFIFILGLCQLILIVFLSWKYLKWTWGPDNWLPRYVTTGLIPFTFFLSYFTRDKINSKWENKIALGSIIILIITFLNHSEMTTSYWGHHTHYFGDERTINLREKILNVNGYGRVNYVLGLKPNLNPFEQYDINDVQVNIYWQLYSGGPFSITPINKMTPFGGKTPLPCEARQILPEAIIEGLSYAVDYCEKDKVTLRIVK